MITVAFPDGKTMACESGITGEEVAGKIGAGLKKAACACILNGKVCDLRTPLTADTTVEILTFDQPQGREAFWHTASHILAQAVKRLYPTAKLAIGPATADGFYYDVEVETPFTPEQLEQIEKEMKTIVKAGLPITQFTLKGDEAIARMTERGEPYKVELIEGLIERGEELSFYQQEEFLDLCAGPHLMNTQAVKAIKLTQCTGAYWRGDANNRQLCRIYGTAFPKASQLAEHLERVEQAKLRDHNKIGRELGFFTTSEKIGQGLPILLPKGARVIQLLQRFVEDEEQRHGWQLTKTPAMAKSDLYRISGHWDHYREGMFVIGSGEEDADGGEILALRPMTCPFQYQAYLNKKRSYRDLPLRYNETSTLFRNEASGEMHGLIRVRQFTISEGHLICTPAQLAEEFEQCLKMTIGMMKTLGLYEDISYRFSQWDPNNREKYIGTAKQWEESQAVLGAILDRLGISYEVGMGEAAFYGPKLDLQIKNVHGKEDTLITIQIDQMLAEKFGMEYVDADGTQKHPYIIHRTSIGCYERTLALLIEKYAGAFPLWLAPVQVRILPIADRHQDHAKAILAQLQQAGIWRVELDDRSEKIGYKIREAQLEKIPYMILIGDQDIADEVVSLRSRVTGDLGQKQLADVIALLQAEIATKAPGPLGNKTDEPSGE